MHFQGGHKTNEKRKLFTAINVRNSEILNVYNVEVQKWYLGKNTKKNKKYEIFLGVTFYFSRFHNSDF